MITFSGNFYFSTKKITLTKGLAKKNIIEIITTTGMGFESDAELDKYEREIEKALLLLLVQNEKLKKYKKEDAVYFVTFEDAKWLESKKQFKSNVSFNISKTEYTSKEFVATDKKLKKEDAKALAKVETIKEE